MKKYVGDLGPSAADIVIGIYLRPFTYFFFLYYLFTFFISFV